MQRPFVLHSSFPKCTVLSPEISFTFSFIIVQGDRFPLLLPGFTWKDKWPCLRRSTFVLFHWDLLLHHFSPLRLLFPLLTIFPTADLCYFWHMSLVILKAIFHYLVTLPRVALFLLELLSLVFFQPAVGCVSFTCFQTSIPFKLILLLIDSTFAASKISASSCTVHLGYHMSTGNFSFVFFFFQV